MAVLAIIEVETAFTISIILTLQLSHNRNRFPPSMPINTLIYACPLKVPTSRTLNTRILSKR